MKKIIRGKRRNMNFYEEDSNLSKNQIKKIIKKENEKIKNIKEECCMTNEDFKKMTYIEFKDWCNDRACDGQWGVNDAMICIKIMEAINSIHIKGFFKKKATVEAQEEAWKDIFLD